jgi:hypothetical protein
MREDQHGAPFPLDGLVGVAEPLDGEQVPQLLTAQALSQVQQPTPEVKEKAAGAGQPEHPREGEEPMEHVDEIRRRDPRCLSVLARHVLAVRSRRERHARTG